MPKRLRKFIYNSIRTMLFLAMVLAVYVQIGPFLAGDYYTLILAGISITTATVLTFIVWRLWTGMQNGDFFLDD